MKKYDGWTIKSPRGHLYPLDFRETRTEAIKLFEKTMSGLGPWRKFRRRGWKIVKVKFVEVKEE